MAGGANVLKYVTSVRRDVLVDIDPTFLPPNNEIIGYTARDLLVRVRGMFSDATAGNKKVEGELYGILLDLEDGSLRSDMSALEALGQSGTSTAYEVDGFEQSYKAKDAKANTAHGDAWKNLYLLVVPTKNMFSDPWDKVRDAQIDVIKAYIDDMRQRWKQLVMSAMHNIIDPDIVWPDPGGQNIPLFFNDASGRWSMIRYYQTGRGAFAGRADLAAQRHLTLLEWLMDSGPNGYTQSFDAARDKALAAKRESLTATTWDDNDATTNWYEDHNPRLERLRMPLRCDAGMNNYTIELDWSIPYITVMPDEAPSWWTDYSGAGQKPLENVSKARLGHDSATASAKLTSFYPFHNFGMRPADKLPGAATIFVDTAQKTKSVFGYRDSGGVTRTKTVNDNPTVVPTGYALFAIAAHLINETNYLDIQTAALFKLPNLALSGLRSIKNALRGYEFGDKTTGSGPFAGYSDEQVDQLLPYWANQWVTLHNDGVAGLPGLPAAKWDGKITTPGSVSSPLAAASDAKYQAAMAELSLAIIDLEVLERHITQKLSEEAALTDTSTVIDPARKKAIEKNVARTAAKNARVEALYQVLTGKKLAGGVALFQATLDNLWQYNSEGFFGAPLFIARIFQTLAKTDKGPKALDLLGTYKLLDDFTNPDQAAPPSGLAKNFLLREENWREGHELAVAYLHHLMDPKRLKQTGGFIVADPYKPVKQGAKAAKTGEKIAKQIKGEKDAIAAAAKRATASAAEREAERAAFELEVEAQAVVVQERTAAMAGQASAGKSALGRVLNETAGGTMPVCKAAMDIEKKFTSSLNIEIRGVLQKRRASRKEYFVLYKMGDRHRNDFTDVWAAREIKRICVAQLVDEVKPIKGSTAIISVYGYITTLQGMFTKASDQVLDPDDIAAIVLGAFGCLDDSYTSVRWIIGVVNGGKALAAKALGVVAQVAGLIQAGYDVLSSFLKNKSPEEKAIAIVGLLGSVAASTSAFLAWAAGYGVFGLTIAAVATVCTVLNIVGLVITVALILINLWKIFKDFLNAPVERLCYSLFEADRYSGGMGKLSDVKGEYKAYGLADASGPCLNDTTFAVFQGNPAFLSAVDYSQDAVIGRVKNYFSRGYFAKDGPLFYFYQNAEGEKIGQLLNKQACLMQQPLDGIALA
jgi:hypothetical protein